MEKLESYLWRKRREYGDKFDSSQLALQFVRFYESGQRIRVRMPYGEELTGTIGVTTGWRPVFILMRTSRSMGSPHILDAKCKVIAVKVGRAYQAEAA